MTKSKLDTAEVIEAEVVNTIENKTKKSKDITLNAPVKAKNTKVEASIDSPWYVFCSTGCGFCKKAEPVIEALNNEGYNILTLDVAEPDNAKLSQELKTEYNAQCGTPWFINAETGKGVCGFRDKDILKAWLDGEDIPEPPRPTGPPPKTPFHGNTDEELENWKGEYEKWLKDNEHMPNLQTVEQVLARPRPKSDPPRPPQPNATDADLETWGSEYKKWSEENSHLPNLQPVDQIIQRFKQRGQQLGQPGGAPVPTGDFEGRLSSIESKLDALVSHLGVKTQSVPSVRSPGVNKPVPPEKRLPTEDRKSKIEEKRKLRDEKRREGFKSGTSRANRTKRQKK